MSAFAQRLSRLRCTTYSTLLRCPRDRHGQSRRWVGAPSGREFGAFARSHVHVPVATCCATWGLGDAPRSCSASAVRSRNTADVDYDTAVTFVDRRKENEFARNFFLSSLKYASSVTRPSTAYAHITNKEALRLLVQDWASMTNGQTVSAVKRLSYNVRYSDEIVESYEYKDAMETLRARCEQLSDDELTTIVRHLTSLRQRLAECTFYYDLCERLDRECVKRFTQLPINDMLALCDALYELTRKHDSQYIWYAIRKLGNKSGKLTPQQLVQVLFFLNVCRKPPINMYELEYRLEQCLDDLSINELGVATLGFFKTGTPIRSAGLLGRIMRKTIADIERVDSVSVGGIAKLIRYSMQLTEINTLVTFLDAMKSHERRFTLMTLTHIAHACARVALYDKEFMDRLAKRLNSELKTARVKDFERLVFVFTSFNIDSSIYRNVIEELRTSWDTTRAQEIAQYPHVVSRIFGFLSYVNVYPTDLIRRIMAPIYVHSTCSGNYHYVPREYCVLNYSLRVEVPEYDGPFLKQDICNFLAKKYFLMSKNTDSCQANLLLMNVLQTCKEIFNSTSDITIDRVLPHYATADIILCLDEQNRLVPSEKYLSGFTAEEIKRVDKEVAKNVRWIALIMATQGLLIRGTNQPVGLLAARIRQLSLIGYTPIIISQMDWKELRLPQKRCEYIKNLIFENDASKVTNT